MTEKLTAKPVDRSDDESAWSLDSQEYRDDEFQNVGALAERFLERANSEPSDSDRFAGDFLEGLMLRADEGKIASEAHGGVFTSVGLAEMLLDFEDIARSYLVKGEKIPFNHLSSADDLRKAIIKIFKSEFHDAYVDKLKDRIELQKKIEEELKKVGGETVDVSGIEEPIPEIITSIPESIIMSSVETVEPVKEIEQKSPQEKIDVLTRGLSDVDKANLRYYAISKAAKKAAQNSGDGLRSDSEGQNMGQYQKIMSSYAVEIRDKIADLYRQADLL